MSTNFWLLLIALIANFIMLVWFIRKRFCQHPVVKLRFHSFAMVGTSLTLRGKCECCGKPIVADLTLHISGEGK